jgi:cobalamin biosynthesis protein CobT
MINFSTNEIEDSLRVVADFIGDKGVTVVYHDKPSVYADVDTKTIYIPRTGTLNHKTLMMLRGKVYHEAGHCSETKLPKGKTPSGVKFKILNAVEDRRMEGVLKKKYKGAGPVLSYQCKELNKEYATSINKEKQNPNYEPNPVMEALVGMSFKYEGLVPAWTVSDEANDYMDECYEEFCKTRLAENTSDCLKIADKIYEIMKDMNQEPDNEDGEDEGEGQGNEEGDEESDGEGEGQEDSEDDNSGEGQGEEDSEDDNSGEGQGEGEGEEDSEGEGQSEGEGESDSEGEGSSESQGKGQGDSGSEEGDSEQNESSQSKSGGGNKRSGKKNQADEGDVKSEKLSEATLEEMLEDQAQGTQLEDVAAESIKKLLESVDPEDKAYTCKREDDEHIVPEIGARERKIYKERRERVASDIMGMSRYLEQALRSMAMSYKHPYMTRGKIDPKRYTAIAKSLSKQVFFTTDPGSSINTAVSIVIDESGSMGEYLQIQLLAMALGETLNSIKVPFEIIGGTTKYWSNDSRTNNTNGFTRTNPIVYYHYKSFEENWAYSKERITTSSSRKHYVDGEMVEYASMRLREKSETRKIIFSLSDGHPEAGQGNQRLFAGNLRNVCSKCRKDGIEVYGFGINTREPQQFYGKDNFIHLEGNKMGQAFYKTMADIITKGAVTIN